MVHKNIDTRYFSCPVLLLLLDSTSLLVVFVVSVTSRQGRKLVLYDLGRLARLLHNRVLGLESGALGHSRPAVIVTVAIGSAGRRSRCRHLVLLLLSGSRLCRSTGSSRRPLAHVPRCTPRPLLDGRLGRGRRTALLLLLVGLGTLLLDLGQLGLGRFALLGELLLNLALALRVVDGLGCAKGRGFGARRGGVGRSCARRRRSTRRGSASGKLKRTAFSGG